MSFSFTFFLNNLLALRCMTILPSSWITVSKMYKMYRLITVILYNLELRYCIELLNFDFAVYTYEKCLFASQACLREIHASILRKHLHRLEHPGAVEQDVESEKEDDNKLEDEMHEDEGLPSFLITQSTMFPR